MAKHICIKNIVFSMLLALLSCTPNSMVKRSYYMQSGYKDHPDLKGDDILAKCRHKLANAKALKERLTTKDNFSSILNIYNDIFIEIDASINQASLLSQVHPQKNIRKDAEICEQEIANFVTEISLDKKVYESLTQVKDEKLSLEEKRMLTHTLREFRRAGVDKDDIIRQQIKTIKADLVTIGQQFGQNIREDRFVIELDDEKQLSGLPNDYILSHPKNANGKIEISTDYPDYIPFMQYANDATLREKLRFKYLNRGSKNNEVLKAMMIKRFELAKLLSYTSYADYIVEDKMIKNANNIYDFINNVSSMAKAGADKEYQALVNYKKQFDKNAHDIYGYETAFLEQNFKKTYFDFDAQSVRPYFSYVHVRDGLLNITKKLFNINYQPVKASVWDESVESYDVYDENGKIGRIHLDMHPRDGKYKHAAQFSIISGLKSRQYPEGALVCNFPNPQNGPALMEHDQVVTMFHEFGHLLHHILGGAQNWIMFSGVATEWDFVEAPSQLLEEWAWSYEVLSTFAHHYESKSTIPVSLVNKMRAAHEFGKALAVRQQMFYAALSVDYFHKDPQNFEPLSHLKQLQKKYSYYPYEEGTNFQNSFGHLDGYSAMYYTYMWSLSLAKDLFEPFRLAGIMNLDLAKKYKDTILKPGGSKDAADLIKDFLGRPYSLDSFKRWLEQLPNTNV